MARLLTGVFIAGLIVWLALLTYGGLLHLAAGVIHLLLTVIGILLVVIAVLIGFKMLTGRNAKV